jgi:uncharacterized protein
VRTRLAGGVVGLVFGVTLSWTGLSSPEVLRSGLLLESSYLYLFFVAAVATSTLGLWLLRRARVRALLTGEPVGWTRELPRHPHVLGSVIFGVGWAVADACPGPIATQVGQGVLWSLFTITGVVAGIVLALHVGEDRQREQGADDVLAAVDDLRDTQIDGQAA